MTMWLLIAAVAAVADWYAVHAQRQRLESVAKPTVMLALIGLALTADVVPPGSRPWIVVALVCGLLGDLALLPQIDQFIVGLGSFLVGHLAYVSAFLLAWHATPWIGIGAIGAVGLVWTFALPIERAIRESALRWPVLAYMSVTCLLIVTGAGTGRWLIAVGALAFAVSDGLLGWNRFVSPTPDRRLWVHVLYHSGQAAIVAGGIAA